MSNGDDDWRRRMREAADRAASDTDQELSAQLSALKETTTSNLEALKPQITDKESYEKLIQAVAESTQRNESLAQLEGRIRSLGSAVVSVAGKAAKLLV